MRSIHLILFLICALPGYSSTSDSVLVENLLQQSNTREASNLESSIVLVQSALKKTNEERLYRLKAKCHINLAYKFLRKGDFDSSKVHFHITLELGEKYNDSLIIASGLTGLGNCYMNKYQMAHALKNYSKALKIDQIKKDTALIAADFNNIGNVHFKLMNYREALHFYQQSLRCYKSIQAKESSNHVLQKLAKVYANQDSLNKALEYYSLAYKGYYFYNDYDAQVAILNNIGLIHKDRNELDKASFHFKEALKFKDKVKGTRAYVTTAYNLLQVSNEIPFSIDALQLSYQDVVNKGDMELEMKTVGLIHSYYLKRDKIDSAYRYLALYTNLKDSFREKQEAQIVAVLQAQSDFELLKLMEQQQRIEQERIRSIKQERRDQLKYSFVLIGLTLLFVGVFYFLKIQLSESLLTGMVFFSFVVLFEFLLTLFDPWVDQISMGRPVIKFGANTLFALAIIPMHNFFEKKLRNQVMKNER